MEKHKEHARKGEPVVQTAGPVSDISGDTDTSTTDAPDSSKSTGKGINWGGSIRKLLEYANVEEGQPTLTQAIGNFEDAPEFFWNSVGQGVKVVVNKDASDITLIFQDGSEKQITL